MLEHASSICSEHRSSIAPSTCTNVTDVLTKELLTFSRYLSLRIAREKTAEKKLDGGVNDRLLRDLAALARRVEEQPERFGIQGDADA